MSRPIGHSFKLAGPDHLRALAIILVFLFHYSLFSHPAWVDAVGSFGWTGVDLFFVLSGYLIAGQLFKQVADRQTIELGTFFIKRFFRIIPAYAVVLMIYFCIPAFREREALPPLWKFLSFTQNFGLDLRHQGTFSHAWSLCIEEQFYLLLPFIILCLASLKLGKRSAYVIGVLFLLGFILRLMTWNQLLSPLAGTDGFGLAWYKWMYYPSYNRLDGLLVGVSLAGIWRFYPSLKASIIQYGNLLLLIGLAILGMAWYLCLDPRSFGASVFGFPLIAIGYGCILAAALSPACWLYRFHSKASSATAALSYAIYLSHKGLIHITQEQAARMGIGQDSNLVFLLCVISTLSGAIILRYAVEKPFLVIRNKLLKKESSEQQAIVTLATKALRE